MASVETQAPLEDATAAAGAAEVEVPAAIVAQSLGEYARASWARLRAGQSGVLPVLAGMVVITVVFEIISPRNTFLSGVNLVNLFQQSAVVIVLGMAEGFALLLGEIDLSVGFMAAVGAAISVQLVQPNTTNFPWWLAITVSLGSCALLGALQGTIISRLHVPSFVVTLAGFLVLNGLFLIILLLGPFSGYPSLGGLSANQQTLHNLMWGNIDQGVSWIAAAAIVGGLGFMIWRRDSRRRQAGLVAPPPALTAIRIVLIAASTAVVVAICGINRAAFGTLDGVPWVIPIVLCVLTVWTILLQRTRYGRYVYAIGGNPEAARRAGVNLARVRTIAFTLCAFTAGIAGLLYGSLIGGMSNNFPGGQYVLFAVAAAVIGGTSLFGGRGKMIHGVLGGLVIGGINNGLYLLGLDVQIQFIVTGLVLLVAATIDATSRRGAASGSAARV